MDAAEGVDRIDMADLAKRRSERLSGRALAVCSSSLPGRYNERLVRPTVTARSPMFALITSGRIALTPTLEKPCYQGLFSGCLAIAGIEASLLRNDLRQRERC
jgi:hypothetical protein